MFIYLRSGEVQEVPKATSMSVVGKTVLVYGGKDLLVSFPQTEVWFTSKAKISPFAN
jgi:hypothetical protein